MKSNSRLSKILSTIEKEINGKSAVLQKVKFPNYCTNVDVYLKREDLLHQTISGNKWRKLKYNILSAAELGCNTLLTFGGAYSNHIHAAASAGKIFGFKTIGIIRGEEHLPLNPTLNFAKECGMEIYYVNRTDYRKKKDNDFIENLKNKFGDFYLVPEGGTNNLAIKGCTEIIKDINIDFNYIFSACGTGGTISGVICGLKGKKNVIGIPVLKGSEFLKSDINNYVFEYSNKFYSNWVLDINFHLGGYAKITKELVLFINEFEKLNSIKLDPVYTGKLMFAIQSKIKNNEFPENSTIIALHTGGLQGIDGMKNKMQKLLA